MNETITDFYGHKQINFTINGRNSFIVSPEKPLDGNHWVWRTEFFGAFDYADRALLERGWYLAYHSVSDMYGCPESITMMREFYDVAVNEYKLNPRPALFGFSRGGRYAACRRKPLPCPRGAEKHRQKPKAGYFGNAQGIRGGHQKNHGSDNKLQSRAEAERRGQAGTDIDGGAAAFMPRHGRGGRTCGGTVRAEQEATVH